MCVRCGGLVLSMLDSGASGPGSSPGRGDCVVFLGKTLYSHSATEVYKWVPATLMLGVALRWTSIPSRGGVEILLVASCYRPGISSPLMGHVVRMETLPKVCCLHVSVFLFLLFILFHDLKVMWILLPMKILLPTCNIYQWETLPDPFV